MRTAILARPISSDNEPLPLPTPAAIAATVRYGARMQAAEAELAAARRRRTELHDETRALIARRDETGAEYLVHPRLREIAADREQIEARIRELRPGVREARTERAGRVADALHPMQREAAAAFLAALVELRRSAGTLEDIAIETERAGGLAVRAQLPDLGAAEALARRLAG